MLFCFSWFCNVYIIGITFSRGNSYSLPFTFTLYFNINIAKSKRKEKNVILFSREAKKNIKICLDLAFRMLNTIKYKKLPLDVLKLVAIKICFFASLGIGIAFYSHSFPFTFCTIFLVNNINIAKSPPSELSGRRNVKYIIRNIFRLFCSSNNYKAKVSIL